VASGSEAVGFWVGRLRVLVFAGVVVCTGVVEAEEGGLRRFLMLCVFGDLQLPSSRFYQSNIRVCETVMSDDAGIVRWVLKYHCGGLAADLSRRGYLFLNLLKAI